MAKHAYCGLDFGTSNSTLGLVVDGKPQLVPLEAGEVTLPSSLFFDYENHSVHFGREAIATYMEGGEGRLMRALKSILGTSTIHETTMIGPERKPFTAVLALFLQRMKRQAEKAIGQELSHVVMGRPVHFIDYDETADREAEDTLRAIAAEVGFKHIEFQFEPVAAARDFHQTTSREELAMIIDIGGGTSDFTVLKVSPQDANRIGKPSDTVLANAGIHVGGTDFDRWLSLSRLMPLLGYQSPMIKEGRLMPVGYYHDLATWQRINFLYDHKTFSDLKVLRREAKKPQLIERLLKVLELREGHRLALGVEEAKVTLSDHTQAEMHLDFIEANLTASMSRDDLVDALSDGTERVKKVISEAITSAGVKADAISVVFLTGGSTKVPYIRDSLTAMVPNARIIDGDAFGSVGIGLALEAHQRFS